MIGRRRKPGAAPPGKPGKLGKPAARRPRRGGVLLVIAGFLFASGLLRLGDGTGAAIAREFGALAGAATAASPARSEGEGTGLEELMAAIRAREARLTEAETALAEREQSLAIAEQDVQRGLVALSEAETSLKGLLTLADTAAEADVAGLTAMYESMKPADAAALFEQMEPSFAAGFLARMRPDSAGAILAGLPPEKAYVLSVVLAGRNATVKLE